MELTSKQRAQLRGVANTIDTIVHIGKDGISSNIVKQANDALEAREIIKCKVLENSLLTAREACEQMARLTRSEAVQVIGTKFVLYRQHYDTSGKLSWFGTENRNKEVDSGAGLCYRSFDEVMKGKRLHREDRNLWRDLQPHPSGAYGGGPLRCGEAASG